MASAIYTAKEMNYPNGVHICELEIDPETGVVAMILRLDRSCVLRFSISGPDDGQRLLLIAHHLVVDGVSWRILLEDLAEVYSQLRLDRPVQLPPKTMSFKKWSEQLVAYGQSATAQAELPFWSNQQWSRADRIPSTISTAVLNTVESASSIAMSLSEAETDALLQDVPSAYNSQINDVLLTALVEAYAQWSEKRCCCWILKGMAARSCSEELISPELSAGSPASFQSCSM